ncbi:MAG TPA: homoserine dehydrogenase [Vicinamibacterales bacterium]
MADATVEAQSAGPSEIYALTLAVESLETSQARTSPAGVVRMGVLGLGNVGSAFVRLAHEERNRFTTRCSSLATATALVRSTAPPRAAARLVPCVTADPDVFFAQPLDVVVEALGGVDAPLSLVARALDRGLPVVTANKSLIARHGDSLERLARARNTALRYEASCIAGVPFLGAFERRPLASRVRGLAAILNGTSNAILSGVDEGALFENALSDAQRLGLAEPDPSADLTGRDASEKLALLLRRFGSFLVTPEEITSHGIDRVDPIDLRAARALEGTIKPIACARWSDGNLQAHVGPAFLLRAHPLATLGGAMNGIVLDAVGGPQCFLGPGAGPEVTAATLLDDVLEVASEWRVREPAPHLPRKATPRPLTDTAWFLRISGDAPQPDTSDLLGTFGVWSARTLRTDGRLYALSFPIAAERVDAALEALRAALGCETSAIPAVAGEALAC